MKERPLKKNTLLQVQGAQTVKKTDRLHDERRVAGGSRSGQEGGEGTAETQETGRKAGLNKKMTDAEMRGY